MEITWTYNWLESIAFIGLVIVGFLIAVKVIAYILFWLIFRNR